MERRPGEPVALDHFQIVVRFDLEDLIVGVVPDDDAPTFEALLGIYKALMTTAAGLAVAIPAIVLHHFLRGKLEVFAENSGALYREIDEHMTVARAA